ncbi:MAG: CheR family methyltransferase, partial [Planctomycetota bacterium]
MRQLHATLVRRYLDELERSEEEQDRLYRDLLIGVTRFFRDPDAFRVLEERVLPELLSNDALVESGIRMWIAGCASGEEPYSVGMLAHEISHRMGKPANVRIFATDAHRGSIDFAGAGRYTPEQMADISAERRDRYFVHSGGAYQVGPTLRSMITFAPHNLLADAPFTRMDLVICRNMMIYFKPSAQHRALGLLHFALKVGGTLMLGTSETPGRLHKEFDAMDAHWRVYRKKRNARLLVEGEISGLSPRMDVHPRVMAPTPGAVTTDARVQKAYDEILEQVLPAGFLLNDRREVVHTFGRAHEVLRPTGGRVNLDVLEMVDPEVRVPLSAAIVRATREQRTFRYDNVNLKLGDSSDLSIVEAKPISLSADAPPYVLVTILEQPKALSSEALGVTPEMIETFSPDELSAQKIAALEHELQYTKENLQATVEEMETTNEELNATNEELIASNEELQSTNEELQSVNEELHTVNAEYQQKITELTALTDDMDNLLACTDIGTLFLDPDMNVRKFTPAVQDHFRLRDQDLGRPIDEITSRISGGDVVAIARRVFETGKPEEFESRGGGGVSLLVRVTAYRTSRGLIDGVVITLVDVTRIRQAEILAARLAEQNQLILDHIPAWVWYKDKTTRVVRANRAAAEATGIPLEQLEGARTEDLHPEEAEQYIRDDREVMDSGRPKLGIIEPFQSKHGEQKWIRTDKVPMRDEDGGVMGLLVVTTDITQLRASEQKLKELSRRLELSMFGAKQATWDWRPDTGETVFSDTWYTMLGYDPQELPMTFETWEKLAHPEDAKEALAVLEAHIAGACEQYEATLRMRT